MRILRRLKDRMIANRLQHAHRKHRAIHGDAYLEFDAIVERFRESGGLNHPWQHYKLFCLRELLRERRPKSLLELGSGTTTAVFADYVRSSPDARLTVIDESVDWLTNAREIARITESPRFSLLVKQAVRVQREARVSYEYRWTSDEAYDFILIDGPSRHREKTAINGNIIDLLPYRPQTIVVDGRETVAAFLDQILSGYRSERSDVFTRRYYPGYHYFSIFTDTQPRAGQPR